MPVGRRGAAVGIPIALLAATERPSRAGIPTMEDYYGTMSGAKVRLTKEERDAANAKFPQLPTIESMEDLAIAWDELIKQAGLLRGKIEVQDFEGVLDIISSPLYKGLSAACRSNREATTAPRACLDSPIALPDSCTGTLRRLRARVLDLDSFAFMNRVFYFNSTDKKQLNQLTSDTGVLEKIDLSEPLEMADDIVNLAKELRAKLTIS